MLCLRVSAPIVWESKQQDANFLFFSAVGILVLLAFALSLHPAVATLVWCGALVACVFGTFYAQVSMQLHKYAVGDPSDATLWSGII